MYAPYGKLSRWRNEKRKHMNNCRKVGKPDKEDWEIKQIFDSSKNLFDFFVQDLLLIISAEVA